MDPICISPFQTPLGSASRDLCCMSGGQCHRPLSRGLVECKADPLHPCLPLLLLTPVLLSCSSGVWSGYVNSACAVATALLPLVIARCVIVVIKTQYPWEVTRRTLGVQPGPRPVTVTTAVGASVCAARKREGGRERERTL